MANQKEARAVKDWYIQNFHTFENKLNGESGSDFHQLRREAVIKLNDLEFPSIKDEEWKYTNISPILKHNFVPSINSKEVTITANQFSEHLFSNFDYHLIIFVNGIFNAELSKIGELPEGVVVSNLKTIIKSNPDLIKKYSGKLSNFQSAFDALNLAYASDGLFVMIPGGKVLEKPVLVVNFSGSDNEEILNTPRNLIIADKSSQASIIFSYNGIGKKKYFNNIATDIFADHSSIINLYKIQEEFDDAFHIEKLNAQINKNASFSHYNISFGGELVRNELNSMLTGDFSECNYWGLYLGSGGQHIDNHTFIDHASPNCPSNELYKGILDDNARGVFNGKILVRKDAQKTNAYQSNKTVLLSKQASIDTKPQLEIYADDVKCSHGATIGHLDSTAYFYIRSRGVPGDLAKSMLIRAFANDVVDKIKINELKEQINHKIFERLHRIEI